MSYELKNKKLLLLSLFCIILCLIFNSLNFNNLKWIIYFIGLLIVIIYKIKYKKWI